MFITMFTKSHHLTTSYCTSNQSTASNSFYVSKILVLPSHLYICLPMFSSLEILKLKFVFISHLCVCCMSNPSHSSMFKYPNMCWQIQIMKLLIILFLHLLSLLLLCAAFLLSIHFSDTLNYILHVREQTKMHTYKTADNLGILHSTVLTILNQKKTSHYQTQLYQ